jgi:phosphoglycolate phosphatase
MKLALFDIDGTLVDSQAMIVASLTAAFTAEELEPPPRAKMLAIVGLSLVNAMAKLAPGLETDRHERLARAYKQAFWSLRETGTHPENLYEGALPALEDLRTCHGVLLGIATGKSRRGVDHLIGRHGWSGWFASIQTSDHHPSKPHPSMVIQALAETGCEPHEAVVIGDTSYDIEMARASGAGAVGVAWGNHSVDDLKRAGAHAIVKDFSELRNTIELIWQERSR